MSANIGASHLQVEDRKCRVLGNGDNVSRKITGIMRRQEHPASPLQAV